MSSKSWASLQPSEQSKRSENPFDGIVKRVSACTDKTPLKLSIGDPTFDGNLTMPKDVSTALAGVIKGRDFNGYPPTIGYKAPREAVAKYWERMFIPSKVMTVSEDDIILTCGGADAIMLTMISMANPGENILIPSPGFTQYSFLCKSYGIEGRNYKLDPESNWQVDLDNLRSLADDKTRAIFLNNPSNPCGSNFSRKHVEDIIALANELQLPIISDEIYAGMVFEGETFTSVADVPTEVPRLIIGGMAKNFMMPGYRMGWILAADPKKYLHNVLDGIRRLTGVVCGPNGIVQGAMPDALNNTPLSYFEKNVKEIESNSKFTVQCIDKCSGLRATMPQGAMYVMVRVDCSKFKDIANDVEFYEKLHDEENVQVVPGVYFNMPNYFRITTTRPHAIIEEAAQRMQVFCERHTK